MTLPQVVDRGEGHRKWWVFAAVSLALFVASIDQTIVATALPAIEQDLDADVNWTSWTISVYALGQVIALPITGRLSDIFGRRRVFILAVLLFSAGSLGCVFADNIYQLVALRAVQALGGGAFIPSGTGIIADEFGPDRDRAIGFFASIFPIGGVVGPVLGGVIVTYSSWRAIFLVNLPIGAAVILISLWKLSAGKGSPGARIDLLGVSLLASSLLSAMIGITQMGHPDVSLVGFQVLVPIVLALALGVLFLRRNANSYAPVVPVQLLRERAFAAMNAINFMIGNAALGFGALVPLYAQLRYGYSPLAAGTLLTARAMAMFVVATATVMLLRRIGYRVPMLAGSVVVAVGITVIALTPPSADAYAWLWIGTALTGFGMGLSVPSSNLAMLNRAPELAAGLSGLRGMFRQFGSITGISVITAFMARSDSPAMAQGHAFLACAVLMLATMPLILAVPDHRGQW